MSGTFFIRKILPQFVRAPPGGQAGRVQASAWCDGGGGRASSVCRAAPASSDTAKTGQSDGTCPVLGGFTIELDRPKGFSSGGLFPLTKHGFRNAASFNVT